MQILSLILLLAAAFGVFILAMKYLLGPAPAGYHAEILKADNIEITGILPTLFRAINIVFASSFFGNILCDREPELVRLSKPSPMAPRHRCRRSPFGRAA